MKEREGIVTEKYYRYYVNNEEPKLFSLRKASDLLSNLNKTDKYPILIDERASKSESEIDNASILPGKVKSLIQEWNKVFTIELQEKDISLLLEGRITEPFLKLHYIEDHQLDKKYPEFTLEKMLDVLVFPDFERIIEAGTNLCHAWWRFENSYAGIFKLQNVFNQGEPTIFPEWERKIKAGNRLEVSNPEQKKDLILILNFTVSLLQIIERMDPNPRQLEDFWDEFYSENLIKLAPLSININKLKGITGISNFDLSGKKKTNGSSVSTVQLTTLSTE